jgi:hypothetical protein
LKGYKVYGRAGAGNFVRTDFFFGKNQSGNGFSAPITIALKIPYNNHSKVWISDIKGAGSLGFVLSTPGFEKKQIHAMHPWLYQPDIIMIIGNYAHLLHRADRIAEFCLKHTLHVSVNALEMLDKPLAMSYYR